MIYYTYKANDNVIPGQFVQLSSDELTVENHTTGAVIGLCIRSYISDDDSLRYAEIYVAGGSGQQAILNANWNGSPSRFDVVNSKVEAVASGGIGWIIPELPRASKSAGETVYISIY
jgi:hypothetical protein